MTRPPGASGPGGETPASRPDPPDEARTPVAGVARGGGDGRDADTRESSRIDGLLGEWRTRCDAGETLRPEDVIAANPDIADSLRARFEALDLLGAARRPVLRDVTPDRYDEFRVIGLGGMGIVYWAVDTDLSREVAFKVVRPDAGPGASPAPAEPRHLSPPAGGTPASQAFATLKARFLHEARITAGLEHPGVVPVYEVGQTPEGVPYYTMRFVRGSRTLAGALEAAGAGTFEERLALLEAFLKVCDTIRYAHAHGVIHRDIKPENIALGEFGEVVVLDWGLAKMTGRPDAFAESWHHRLEEYRAAADVRTLAGAIGTPGYMSPEAALGRTADVNEQSDVYSLGVILFQILTGRLPFEFRTFGEFVSKLLHETPPDPASIDPRVPPGISAVCRRALEREAPSRTPSAGVLAAEVRSWAAERARDAERAVLVREAEGAREGIETSRGEEMLRRVDVLQAACTRLLAADPGNVRGQALLRDADVLQERAILWREMDARRRFAQRAGVGVLLLLVVAGAIVTRTLDHARREAVEAKGLSQRALEQSERERLGKEKALRRARATGLAGAAASEETADPMRALILAREAVRIEPLPEAVTRLRESLLASLVRTELRGHEGDLVTAAWSPDGTRILTASRDASARVWDAAGRSVAVLRGHRSGLRAAALSPDGRCAVTASDDGTARLWDLATGSSVVLAGHTGPVSDAAFSPSGDHVVTAGDDRTVRVWSRTGESVAVSGSLGAPVRRARFDAAGSSILTLTDDGTARILDPAGRERTVLRGHAGPVRSAEWSATGDRVVTASLDRTARVWDAAGGEVAVLRGHALGVNCATFSPAGDRIVTGGEDRCIRVWDVTGTALRTVGPLEEPVNHVAFAASGDRFVAAAGWSGAVHVRSQSGGEVATLRGHDGYVPTASISPDGSRVLTACWDDVARIGSLVPEEAGTFARHEFDVWDAQFSPSGDAIATASGDSTGRLWDLSGRCTAVLRHDGGAGVNHSAFSPRGDAVAIAGNDGRVVLWDRSGRLVREIRFGDVPVRAAEWDATGDRIVAACGDNHVRIWDLRTGDVGTIGCTGGQLAWADFSPAGDRIVTSHTDGTARILDLEGRVLKVLRGHDLRCWGAVMSPAGTHLGTWGEDTTARIHDLASGAVTVLRGHEKPCTRLAFAPDGRTVATGSADGTVRLWDQSGSPLGVIRTRAGYVLSVAFDPTGTRVLSACGDGTARLWFVRTQDVLDLADRRILRDITSAERERFADLLDAETDR